MTTPVSLAGSDELRVVVNDASVQKLVREFPREVNSEFNKGLRKIAFEFSSAFSKSKLEGAGAVYRVKRKGRQRSGGGRVRVATKFALAGFKSRLENPQTLERKRLALGTSNPLLLIRETGGTIRPKLGTRVRGSGAGKAGIKASAQAGKRIPYLAVRYPKRGRGGKGKFTIRLVRQVTVKAALGYRAAWSAFGPRASLILQASLAAARVRAEKLAVQKSIRAIFAIAGRLGA